MLSRQMKSMHVPAFLPTLKIDLRYVSTVTMQAANQTIHTDTYFHAKIT